MSQQIHPRIDDSVYLALKARDVNISQIVNDLLKNFVNQEEMVTDESIILDNIAEIKSKVNDLNDKLKTEVVKLQILKEKKSEEQRKNKEKLEVMSRNLRHNNPLRGLDL